VKFRPRPGLYLQDEHPRGATHRQAAPIKPHHQAKEADVKTETTGTEKAAALRALHVPGRPLVMPNAWDVASARMIEEAGFPAVATSSAAIAAVLGWGDGEAAPVEDMLAAAGRIARSVSAPVTVDFERGYGLGPAELVERFAGTGAAGLNLEDSDPATGVMVGIAEQADFLAAVRAAAESAGLDLVINARTDSFLRRAGSPEEQLAASIERSSHYLAAGADCVYPLGVAEPRVIRTLVEAIRGPVNVARAPQAKATLAELAGLGVARVTFGPSLQRQAYGWFASTILPALADGLR
jgi:2-methylisocitrate lyase-like PEP mutase family enzyme